MKKSRSLVLVIFLALLLVGIFGGGFLWWKENSAPFSSSSQEERFVITKGSSASRIGDKLVEEGLIRSKLAFKIYVQLLDKSGQIKPGEYSLAPSLSLVQIIDTLIKGPKELWVTIPEGLRKEEVVGKIIADLGLSGEIADGFRQDFLASEEAEEGFLFPDTYLFPKDVSAQRVVSVFRNTFTSKTQAFKGEASRLAQVYGLDAYSGVIIASLLERETITEEEKPIVAGIILKRLEAGWPLQIDAAVQYAVATAKCRGLTICDWWTELTQEDLEIASAYNLYLYNGLPPTPIANPGQSSLKAAFEPEESVYWFYIHDPQGKIHYAETLEEHNQNIKTYLGK